MISLKLTQLLDNSVELCCVVPVQNLGLPEENGVRESIAVLFASIISLL